MRVRESSQNTYASSLHRYIKYWQNGGSKTIDQILPHTGIRKGDVHLFLAHASAQYKYNTIASTVSALIDWHKDKGVEYTALACKDTKDLLKTIKAEQGPHGIPNGKQGMTKEVLHLLLRHIRIQRNRDPHMEALYLRDTCWLLLGFFGMLRRSEIIALQMQDIIVEQQQGTGFVELRIRRSKNDRRGEGATVTIAGVSKDGLKTARLLQEWVTFRQQQGAQATDPLFTKWDLDTFSLSAQPIRDAATLNKRLQHYLIQLIELYPDLPVNPKSYGMHSLRRGGVMAAWKAGVDVEKIKAHGRWKSDAIRAYMNTTRDMRLLVTLIM
jgi:integrase